MITEIKFTPEQIKAIIAQRELDGPVGIKGRVLAIVKNVITGDEVHIEGINIVTDKGDIYYAQSANGETPTLNFKGANAGLRLGTGTGTPTKVDNDVTTFITGSGKALKSTYPKTNDTGDADNTGDGTDILTWTYEYATGEANDAAIAEGAIVDDKASPTGALTHFKFPAPFAKTSADTLKVIVNHQFNGI